MRFLALVLGMTVVTGAAAEELYAPARDTDALTAQLVYESRFGGAVGTPASSAFKLQFANEGQRLSGRAPLQAEFRPASGEFYVNGLSVERVLVARQEGTGVAGWMGGFFPLVLVIGAAALIVVDGNDQDFGTSGSGGS